MMQGYAQRIERNAYLRYHEDEGSHSVGYIPGTLPHSAPLSYGGGQYAFTT
jgi:hypothetical protein